MKRLTFLFLLIPMFLYGQDIDSLYRRADAFRETFSSGYFYGISAIESINKTNKFWYLTQTPNGNEFFLIDTDTKNVVPAFDPQRLASSLSGKTNKEQEPYKLPFRSIRYNKDMDSVYFSVNDVQYSCSLNDYTVNPVERRQRERPRDSGAYWGRVFKEDSKEKIKSPDEKYETYISEGNLWITELSTKESRKLSTDGSPFEYYSSNIHWSPDSKKIICCKYRPVDTRKLLLVESSPDNQLQPKTEEYDYPKPGDALPIRKPVVFFVEEQKVIEYDVPEVDKQYDLDGFRWDKNSNFFTFNFNKRGHQQYIVYAGEVPSGKLRIVVNEQSNTFVYYNALYQYRFDNSNELLWISERDGWRHIYLYDILTGTVKKQLTKGEWIVKSVVHVDEKNRKILFKGCGMDNGEDPYLEKYYSLNIDNGKIQALTPENANHNVTFSSEYSYMVDNYSRVDMPPKIVVRSTENGEILFELQNQPDISKALAAGWRMPEVFSAKGRDGKTDIWGIIIRPTNFNPQEKYPVIEYIYAGPHDSFVPKSFAVSHLPSALAELGFITVVIDGMGTANRSKAFHDVCWKNLKDAGFPDRIAWMQSAAAKYPEIDITKVGIYGASAGGQSAMGALLFHPEFYKVGVASCGCHDNRMDKIWWNEQWMGYPIGKEYEECSNVVNAYRLEGKLMLILGELDNNVDPSSTLQVVDELIKHKKEFEFVVLPGVRHTLGGDYGERKRRDFFVKYLLKTEAPEWNRVNSSD